MNPVLGPTAHCRLTLASVLFGIFYFIRLTDANQYFKNHPPPKQLSRRASTIPLVIRNQCGETIWPGLLTQSGNPGPPVNGFVLTSGSSRSFLVAENWQGRVWGRTNCSFTSGGTSSKACGTGHCGSNLNCIGTGEVPTTLAEFTLDAGDGHSYYDISLVDGYNLPMAIQMLTHSNSTLVKIPERLTNPSCVATVGEAVAPGYNPYSSGSFLGTTSQSPLSFETHETLADIAQWCPWNLQISTLSGPSGGVYIYPDGSLNRPEFDPCYSACAKSNAPADCCTGAYSSPSSCSPSSYSKAAKSVCPDAYSYAFDDQTSTFIIPSGAGFEVTFCPGGRSTNIIATSHNELVQLAQTGTVSSNKDKRESDADETPALEGTAISTPTVNSTLDLNSTGIGARRGHIISEIVHNQSAAYNNVHLTFVLSGSAGSLARASMTALWIAMVGACWMCLGDG